MNIHDFLAQLNVILPPNTAHDGDAIGLHVESFRGTAKRVLVCLDVTDDVVAEALSTSCDCIVSFHPVMFRPLSALRRNDRVGRIVCDLIRHDISLITVHTTFDAFQGGTNALLAQRLGLEPISVLSPNSSEPNTGMGLLCSTTTPLPMSVLVDRVASVCGPFVRWSASPSNTISTVALVGGSGMSFYDDAVSGGADVFITADVKYHAFLGAQGTIGIIDPGHYEMEQFVPQGISATLSTHIPKAEFVATSIVTNPVRYYAPSFAMAKQLTDSSTIVQ